MFDTPAMDASGLADSKYAVGMGCASWIVQCHAMLSFFEAVQHEKSDTSRNLSGESCLAREPSHRRRRHSETTTCDPYKSPDICSHRH